MNVVEEVLSNTSSPIVFTSQYVKYLETRLRRRRGSEEAGEGMSSSEVATPAEPGLHACGYAEHFVLGNLRITATCRLSNCPCPTFFLSPANSNSSTLPNLQPPTTVIWKSILGCAACTLDLTPHCTRLTPGMQQQPLFVLVASHLHHRSHLVSGAFLFIS